MADHKHPSVRFSLVTAIIWLVVAGGIIFLLWQLIDRISAASLPISTATPDQTEINQTIAALLTPRRASPSETAMPTRTSSPTPKPPALTLVPVASHNLTSTPGEAVVTSTPPTPCNRAAAGNPIDVTIPDDSLVSPGQSFVKTWKLVNDGSCTWTTSYSASFFYGDRMQAPGSVALDESVSPSHSVEISIEMLAPLAAGAYQGNWKLSDPDGALFGIGPNGDSPFWVRIIVPETPSDTATATASLTTTPAVSSTPDGTTTPGSTASVSPTASLTPAATTQAPVQASGELSAIPGDSLDLDSIRITTEDADLEYQVDASHYHWLDPEDEAAIGVYGQGEPDLSDCQSTSMSRAQIAVESLSAGTFLCYTTNDGRFGKALFEALNPEDFTLTLDLLTWASP